ncbi:MAG: hypothetical protein ACSHW1_15015 [Yoonia sp.]|uniref:hypothetical protein n=1 Tax=Yoonia sp. TaxID=2212373 RepID=UPI003EF71E7D
MGAQKQDINDFQRRIKSINNPRNTSYYDSDLGMHVPKRVKRPAKVANREDETFFGPMFTSMIFGAVALMFGQVVRIRYFGVPEATQSAVFLDLFLALWAVIILSTLTKKRSIGERVSQFAGIALMMVGGHNLIWRWPEQMGYIYSPEHVDLILATTEAFSIVYGGTVYSLQ